MNWRRVASIMEEKQCKHDNQIGAKFFTVENFQGEKDVKKFYWRPIDYSTEKVEKV